jgi:hypothetical protein
MVFSDVVSTFKLATAISSKHPRTAAASAKSLKINSIAMPDPVSTLVNSLLGANGVSLLLLVEPRTKLATDIS